MARPRLLLVAEFTELEWAIKPELEEWAEVLSFDPPGVGTEPVPAGMADLGELTREIITTRGASGRDGCGGGTALRQPQLRRSAPALL